MQKNNTAEQLNLFNDVDLLCVNESFPGYLAIFQKTSAGTMQRSYQLARCRELVDALRNQPDTYISQAGFWKRNRRLVNLAKLWVCFVDLDTYKPEFEFASRYKTRQALIDSVISTCLTDNLPLPSVIMSSGQGYYLKWFLDADLPAAALPRWNAVQKNIQQHFEENYNGDSRACDGSRVLRIIGTINSKNDAPVEIVWENLDTSGLHVRHNFETLANTFLPYTREELAEMREIAAQERAERKASPRKVPQFYLAKGGFNKQTLHWSRLADIRLLPKLRGWSMVPKGYQDTFLWLAACSLSWSMNPQRFDLEMEALAREFVPTWTVQEARAVLKTTYQRLKDAYAGKKIEYKGKEVDPRYRITSEYIIDALKISSDEMQHLKTIIDAQEKYRRRNPKRSKQTREEYEANSLSRKKPWEQLGMSRAWWYKQGKPQSRQV